MGKSQSDAQSAPVGTSEAARKHGRLDAFESVLQGKLVEERKWQVKAISSETLYATVIASSKEEAIELAEQGEITDEWESEDNWGNFEVVEAEEVEE